MLRKIIAGTNSCSVSKTNDSLCKWIGSSGCSFSEETLPSARPVITGNKIRRPVHSRMLLFLETCSLTCGPGLQKHNPTCCCCLQDNEWKDVSRQGETESSTPASGQLGFKIPGLWFCSSAHLKLYPCLCVDLLSRISHCLKVSSQPLCFQADHLLPPKRNWIHLRASERTPPTGKLIRQRLTKQIWSVSPRNILCYAIERLLSRRTMQFLTWLWLPCFLFFLWSHISMIWLIVLYCLFFVLFLVLQQHMFLILGSIKNFYCILFYSLIQSWKNNWDKMWNMEEVTSWLQKIHVANENTVETCESPTLVTQWRGFTKREMQVKGTVQPNWTFHILHLGRFSRWWHFLIHVTILEFHSQWEFHPIEWMG